MVYGIYLSAAGLQTSQYQQQILANNLANVNTVGFKEDLALLRERRVETREDAVDGDLRHELLDRLTGGSLVAPTYTSFEQGPLEVTGGLLDAAIVGEGFFVVQDGSAQRYTRDGRFTRNERGELVTVAGQRPVLDEAGNPIVIPAGVAGPVRLEASGEVTAGGRSFGRIRTVGFDDVSRLRKIGGNLFETMGVEPETRETHIRPGAVENSTVDPTMTMVALMQVSRLHEMNATLIGLADATLNRAVNDIPRIR